MLNVTFCHYFNNHKPCPYDEIGCMYSHEQSEACRFQKLCKNKLCQFQHSSDNSVQDVINVHTEYSDIDNESRDSQNFETADQGKKLTETNESNDDLDLSNQTKRKSCKICFRWLKDDDDVKSHMLNEHKTKSSFENMNEYDSESEEEEEEDLQCDDCGKVSDDFDSYIEHRGIGDCVVYCDHCDKTFKEEVDLMKHMEKHCRLCGKEFSAVNNLKLHLKKCK